MQKCLVSQDGGLSFRGMTHSEIEKLRDAGVECVIRIGIWHLRIEQYFQVCSIVPENRKKWRSAN